MTWWHSHPNAAEIVRKHWRQAELCIVALQEPCIAIGNDELRNIERVIRVAGVDDLRRWTPRKSWFVAVMLCPGDQTEALGATVLELGLDPRRFHFYLHAATPVSSLAGWAALGLPLDAVDQDVSDWKELHKLLGVHFNIQIVDDATSPAKP
ncbi:MAG: hypothetical protein QOD77_1190 [Thermoplasmata archaeon]|jgi:hypothetical protein|nr:hypothetical protein [Thermoplasmata archaeon]